MLKMREFFSSYTDGSVKPRQLSSKLVTAVSSGAPRLRIPGFWVSFEQVWCSLKSNKNEEFLAGLGASKVGWDESYLLLASSDDSSLINGGIRITGRLLNTPLEPQDYLSMFNDCPSFMPDALYPRKKDLITRICDESREFVPCITHVLRCHDGSQIANGPNV